MSQNGDSLKRAFFEWQSKLLQLDRSNSLLYFKTQTAAGKPKPGIVRLECADLDGLLVNLTESPEGLAFPYAEKKRKRTEKTNSLDNEPDDLFSDDDGEIYVRDGDISILDCSLLELQKRLRNLRKKDREFEQEQGINVLFLALGFVSWIDEQDKDGLAPLLLLACDLEAESLKDNMRLVAESDDLLVNVTLKQKLSTLRYELPDFEQETDTIASYLLKCESALCKDSDWKIIPDVFLSTFSYSKIAMWEDLERMRSTGFHTPAIEALSGTELLLKTEMESSAITDSSSDDDFSGGMLDDHLEAARQFLVLPADYSQIIAVEAARSGCHLIIHGPPGTGKSQTIANLIGTFMADGKTVLFVSEKSAALDVVKRRLEKSGLGNFCLDLHGRRAKKEAFYEQLRISVDDDRGLSGSKFPYNQLSEHRRELNDLSRALHKNREPLNRSVYRMHGEYAAVREELDVQFELANDEYSPQKLNEDKLRRLFEIAERLATRPRQFQEHKNSMWSSLKDNSSMMRLSDDLRKTFASLIENVGYISTLTSELTNGRLNEKPVMLGDVQHLISLFSRMQTCPGIPEHWLNNETVSRLRTLVAKKREDYSHLQRLQKQTSDVFEPDFSSIDFKSDKTLLDFICAQTSALEAALGPSWQRRIVRESSQLSSKSEFALNLVVSLKEKLAELASELGVLLPTTRTEINETLDIAQKVTKIENVPLRWFQVNSHREIEKSILSSKTIFQSLIEDEKALFDDYNPDIVDKIDKQMRVRFIADYDGFLGPLLKHKQYQADIQTIRVEHRDAKKPTRVEALWVIDRVLSIKKKRTEWDELEPTLKKNLDTLFEDRDTDWEEVSRSFQFVKDLFLGAKVDPSSVSNIVANDVRIKNLKKICVELSELLTQLDISLKEIDGASSKLNFDLELEAIEKLLLKVKEPIADTKKILESWNIPTDKLTDIDQMHSLAECCLNQLNLKKSFEKDSEFLSAELHDRYKSHETDWQAIDAALDWTDKYLADPFHPLDGGLMSEIKAPKDFRIYQTAEQNLKSASENLQRTFSKLDTLFDVSKTKWLTRWDVAPFDDLQVWANELLSDTDNARDYILYRNFCTELEQEIGCSVVDRIREETDDAVKIPGILKRRIVSEWLEHAYSQEPTLRNFAVQDQEDLVRKFKRLDETAWPIAAQEEIKKRVYERYPARHAMGEVSSDMPRLRNELSKKRRRMPIRRLLGKMPELIKTIKPCFFMSPLSVSQHLPTVDATTEKPFFDVLMFDEASQIFPEDAVPSIARCGQLIIVGDEKQLPPTAFFRNAEEQSWENYEAEEEEADNALLDTESVLSALKRFIGRGVYERYLKVHYRSRHESLIQFSNYHFYDKKLLVFPSPNLTVNELGLCDVFVPDGRFDSGASRTNRKEAERVVELVFEHMRSTKDDQSIGVVTLSAAQAELINDLINLKKQNEPDIAYRFSEGLNEEFFVKNLEKVQGDERDHIILCIAYGPTVGTGKPMNRFGPINAPMGPRRLNVAITRSRKKLTLVRSLNAADITGEAEGARLLKRFIEYAQDPVRYFEKQVSASNNSEPDSSFEVAVKNALEARGYKIQCQVGVAGYRIDLGIVSEDGLSYDLGIECDGVKYHSSPSARDRDWLRQKILEELGWNIHRIWSTSWIRSPEQEISRLETALQIARKKQGRPSVPVS